MTVPTSTSRRTRGLTLAILVLLLAGVSGACTSSAPVDQIGLYYTGGPLQGQHFKRVIEPGSGAQFRGIFDDVIRLPAGQRNYIVSQRAGEGDREEADAIIVPARGGIDMTFEISAYFKLNTHTNDIDDYKGGTLRKFYEQICRKYSCETGSGWDRMLNDNFRKVLETSMRQQVFNYTVDELYANEEGEASGDADAILKIQADIAARLKENINRTLGGEFFCGPTFDRAKPACPDFQFNINSAVPTNQGIRDSFAAQRVALNEVETAKNKALAKQAEAEGIRAQQEALRGTITPEYLELQRIEAQKACASNPNCTMIVGGSGSDVIVDSSRSRE